MIAHEPEMPRVPRLASDPARGYAAVVIALVPAFVLQVLMILAVDDIDQVALFAASVLLFWAVFSLVHLVLHFLVFGRADGEQLRHWLLSTMPRTRRAKILYLLNGGGPASYAISGSVVAVIAVLLLSANPEFRAQPAIVYTGIATVVGSLLLTITAYAVRYARQYATEGGFSFPGETEPRFADFFYLAVQVSTTFSSSDVEIRSTAMRNIVTVNSLISFAFNTVIVALLVSALVSSAG